MELEIVKIYSDGSAKDAAHVAAAWEIVFSKLGLGVSPAQGDNTTPEESPSLSRNAVPRTAPSRTATKPGSHKEASR